MSSAANSTVSTVPLERGIEILERRLIELRADIDAILAQLASRKTANPIIEPTDTPEADASVAIAEHEPAPVATVYFGDEADQFSGAAQLDAIEPDQTSVVEPSPETALEKELPIASIEADPADPLNRVDMVLDTTATPVAETAAPQVQMHAVPTSRDAVTALSPPASLEPAADIVPESASESVPAASAETPVISLQSRQRKQKAGFSASASAPGRTGRRLATKIAASIVALLAAATMLVVADKAALGSAQSLPWMSPLPSYGANWPFLGPRQVASQPSPAGDSKISPAPAAAAPAEEALLSRYREVWPGSW